jgi:tetratricopeptide (TPR) repeat protein
VAHNGLGWIRYEQGRLEEAQGHYREAIRLRPDLAVAHRNLGTVMEELGDFEAAEHCFRAALRHGPDHVAAEAHAHLATLLGGRLPEADLADIRRRLADPNQSEGCRRAWHFALGRVLDARGDYAGAAEHLREANALCLADWRRRGQEYSAADHERFIDRMITICTPDFFERVRGFGSESERPVFIVGLPRSGTTLTEQVLASHPQVFGAGERLFSRESFEALPRVLNADAPAVECLGRLDRESARRLAARQLEKLEALDGRAPRIATKTPENYLFLGLLAILFPRARFIHCRRDLRDVAVSCWMTHFRLIHWSSDPDHIASRLLAYQRLMDHFRQVLPVPLLEVPYEETVADLEGVARRLVAWCGLEWEPACLAFHQARRPVRSASLAQVRQPLYTHAVARWKNYQQALAPLLAPLQAHRPS